MKNFTKLIFLFSFSLFSLLYTLACSFETPVDLLISETKMMSLSEENEGANDGTCTVFTLETLGILTSIVSTPSLMYTTTNKLNLIPTFVTKIFTRLSTMKDSELNNLDTDSLNNETLPGLVTLQYICDQNDSTNQSYETTTTTTENQEQSMTNQLKMFQLTLTRKFLTCGFLSIRLKGVEMLFEWIRCAIGNASAAAAAALEGKEGKGQDDNDYPNSNNRKNNTSVSSSDSDSDEYQATYKSKRRGRSGRYGGTYSNSVNPMYINGSYTNYNSYGQQSSSDDEQNVEIPTHSKWITIKSKC